jgi:SAM-dependent methyltransferase
MALEDKEKWDERHQQKMIPDTPILLVTDFARLAPGKKALDIACGTGRNSRYLASKGFEVDALDISSVAINSLQGIKGIHPQEVDLDTYNLPEEKYDLIVCTYYLERRLFPQIIEALKEGGILIYETFVYHPDNETSPSKRRFLLNEGELEAAFDEKLDLLHIREAWTKNIKGEKVMKGSLVGKKKAGGMDIEDFWS